MKIRTHFNGQNLPFEGHRVLMLKDLPMGARITTAKILVTPAASFEEELSFIGGNQWGATQTHQLGVINIDFHTRRRLASLKLSRPIDDGRFMLDMGGVLMCIADDGGLLGAGNTNPLSLNGESIALPSIEVTKFRLNYSSTNDLGQIKVNTINVFSYGTHVHLGLGQFPPFWTQLGELTRARTTDDFAELLQAYLVDAKVENGMYLVPIRLHSDQLTRLDVQVEIEYCRSVNLLPHQLGEIYLPFSYGGLADSPADTIKLCLPLGSQVMAEGSSARVLGKFAESRVALGHLGAVKAEMAVPVRPQAAQAQPILVTQGQELAITAVDLLLAAVSATAVLNLNFLPDNDGKPYGDALLERPVRLELQRDTAGTLAWVNASLQRVLLLRSGRINLVWLVLQVTEGEVIWGADLAEAEKLWLHSSSNGGLSWQPSTQGSTSALSAHYRLRFQPNRYQVPIELAIADERHDLSHFQLLNRVDFTLDGATLASALNQTLIALDHDLPRELELVKAGDAIAVNEGPWVLLPNATPSVAGVPFSWGESNFAEYSVLAQVVPIAGPATYRFVFYAFATCRGARAEIHLLDTDCKRLSSKELPIAHKQSLIHHQLLIEVSAGAVQAEIRFILPPLHFATLHQVTLKMTTDVLVDGKMIEMDDGKLKRWQVDPLLNTISTPSGTLLSNEGRIPSTLSQTRPIVSGKPFKLNLSTLPTESGEAPLLEIRWLDAKGERLAKEYATTITGSGMGMNPIEGTAPETAKDAIVSLTFPPNASLNLHEIALHQPACVEVPFTFIAQAPGELTLSDALIVYKERPRTLPPPPPKGLCPPTPPPGSEQDPCCR